MANARIVKPTFLKGSIPVAVYTYLLVGFVLQIVVLVCNPIPDWVRVLFFIAWFPLGAAAYFGGGTIIGLGSLAGLFNSDNFELVSNSAVIFSYVLVCVPIVWAIWKQAQDKSPIISPEQPPN